MSFNLRLKRLRWQVPLLAFVLVLIHQLFEHTVLFFLPKWYHFATQLLFYGLVGPFLAWWVLSYIGRRVNETESALGALNSAHEELSETSQRLEFLIRVNHRLSEPEDEEELINVILDLSQDVLPLVGCSLIRFDAKEKPITAIHRGGLDPEVYSAWASHLSSQEVRETCKNCSVLNATDGDNCPILNPTSVAQGVKKIHCLELIRGGHKFANLILYLPDGEHPNKREEKMLRAMAAEMSLALESFELRSREFEMLYRLQQARRNNSMHEALANVTSQTVDALKIDGGAMFLSEGNEIDPHCVARVGEINAEQFKLIQGMTRRVSQSVDPLRIADIDLQRVRSLIIVPLNVNERSLGGFALWSYKSNSFTQRHEQMILTVASQAALSIENHQLYLEASFQAGLSERARLAREIHDGLAQTLGYLKLRTSQILKWLDRGETDRTKTALDEVRLLLAGAYTDAREAIDGLRLPSAAEAKEDWLEQVLREFEQLRNIQVETFVPLSVVLLPEVQAQLQRIIQEALSNVRKYSGASKLILGWEEENDWLEIKIVDDGKGFDPNDVPPLNRHGLRIMRERANLLEGELQIASEPDKGTRVTVRFPLKKSRVLVES